MQINQVRVFNKGIMIDSIIFQSKVETGFYVDKEYTEELEYRAFVRRDGANAALRSIPHLDEQIEKELLSCTRYLLSFLPWSTAPKVLFCRRKDDLKEVTVREK